MEFSSGFQTTSNSEIRCEGSDILIDGSIQKSIVTHMEYVITIEAVKYNVLPLDDRQVERIDPATAGRPTLARGNSQLFFAGMGRLSDHNLRTP